MARGIIIILFLTFLLATSVHAIQYPIRELGYCANRESCFNYCQNPKNHDRCTTFADAEKQVLGSRTVSFPIPELGNCSSMKRCAAYCNEEEHYAACHNYVKKMKLQ
jgi:hypothetical protein